MAEQVTASIANRNCLAPVVTIRHASAGIPIHASSPIGFFQPVETSRLTGLHSID